MPNWFSLALRLPASAVLVVLTALGLLTVSYALARKDHWRSAVILVTLAALLIRGYASADRVLHPWDERYHALVAKNLIHAPLSPRLYHTAPLPYDYTRWTGNYVWLHKPPLALWLQAVSMKLFGVNELVMRLPSVVFSSLSVTATYFIGRHLFSPAIGLVAAVFQTFNGFLVDLASGRRASDHVDTLLVFLIELGIVLALLGSRRNARTTGIWLGITCGLAYLTKSVLGALLLPIWVAIRSQLASRAVFVKELLIAVPIAVAISAPWAMYTAINFPLEAEYEARYALRHVTEVLEEQGGPPWQYVWEMPRYFGELVYVPLLVAIVSFIRGTATDSRRAILLWVLFPYALFSLFATKMPAYVMIAAPALFILQADVWISAARQLHSERSAMYRVSLIVLLTALALLPARHLLGPTGPLEERDRNPEWVRQLRALNERIGARRAVIFNLPHNIEAMFYTPYIAYEFMPTEEQIGLLERDGYAVYIFEDGTARERLRTR